MTGIGRVMRPARGYGRRVKRRWMIAGLIAVIFVGVVMATVWPNAEPEPVYQGKKLSAWVGMEMPETRTEERDQTVRQIGTNALPYLLRWISYEPSPARVRVFIGLQKCLPQWIGRRSFFYKLWQGPRGQRQLQAGACFAILGEEASPAVPELLQLAIQRTSWNTREQARRALMSMCKSAIPALIARLEDPSRPGRQMAMEFIGGCAARFQTHDDGAPFVPSLVKLMHEEDAVLVLEAARTLGKLNLEAGLAVPALASGLEHADPQVRRVSAEALELFGREAQSAIPALQRTLEDSDPLIPSISVKVYDPFSGCGWRDSPNGLARVWSLMDTSS